MNSTRARSIAPLLALACGSTAAAHALALLLPAETLKTSYAEARVFDVVYSSETSSETTASSMKIDGEEREGRGPGGGGRTTTMNLSYSDTIVAAKDGAPTKVERTFGDVGGAMEMEMRDDVMEMERTSAFDGITLMLTAGDSGVEVEVTDGDAPDDERLEGMALAQSLTLMLDGLLPDGEVELGGEWDVEGEALLAAIGVQLEGQLLDRPERPGGGDRGGRGGGGGGGRGDRAAGQGGQGGGSVLAIGEWEITAKLTDATEDIDGVEAQVIEIKAEVKGTPPEREGRGGRDRSDLASGGVSGWSPIDNSFEGEFEGMLYWSKAEQRPVRFTFKGMYELNTETTRETERGTFERSSTVETTVDISIDIAARSTQGDD